MSIDGQSDETIRAILTGTRRIAWSAPRTRRGGRRSACSVPARARHDATPVNPLLAGRAIHGRTVVASLAEAVPLEMVEYSATPPMPAPQWMKRSGLARLWSGCS